MTSTGVDAVVVGSGPNGLTAAVTLARRGLSVMVLEASDRIGGGCRSEELTLPGLLHDRCSAVFPWGAASPAWTELPLERHGLSWRWPEIDMAHPLDGGRAGVFVRSLEETARGLGADERAWRKMFRPLVDHAGSLMDDLFRPLVHVPRHPVTFARFGVRAMPPATLLARRFRTDEAKALFGGCAAHVFHPLERPGTAGIGTSFLAIGHHSGWPTVAGGAQAIADSLASLLVELGGRIETGTRVTSMSQLPAARLTLFDTSPRAVVEIAGNVLPHGVVRALHRWRHGSAAFKVDLAVEGGVPWEAEPCHRAGTVHVGGTIEEIALAEREVYAGRMPERPFVLVGQQYLADPQRSVGNVHPVWAYGHVPGGYSGDATEAVLGQIERFAPGLRERVLAMHVTTPAQLESYNANYIGGDVACGAGTLRQNVLRPRAAPDPYWLGAPGMYLCSAATPPGAGVHGICGLNAARRALRSLDRSEARD